MIRKHPLLLVVLACISALAALALSACSSGGSIGVDYPTPGTVEVSAKEPATASVEVFVNTDGECEIELAADVTAGEMAVMLFDADGHELGAYTFGSSGSRHELVDVEAGRITARVQAKGATGKLAIKTVYVLDGPGTPGS